MVIIAVVIAYYYFRAIEKFSSKREKIELKKNDRVSVYWDGDGEWYNGDVTKVYKNGNIDVHYDGYDDEYDDKKITPWDDVVRKIVEEKDNVVYTVAKDKTAEPDVPAKTKPSKPNDPLKEWGNYYTSCDNITFKDGSLTANCKTPYGNPAYYTTTIYNLTDKDKGKVVNCYGTLKRVGDECFYD